MKLKSALEIGMDCDLETVGEALFNISIHRPNLFSYEEMDEEIKQLFREYMASGFKDETLIKEALNQMQ